MIALWVRRVFKLLALALVLLILIVILKSKTDPWEKHELTKLTNALNEAAAIGVPHDYLMPHDVRQAHLALLEKVEAGAMLTISESAAYRLVIQETLLDSQSFLAAFDRQLSVLPDHAMHAPNNVRSNGIAGHHDHHDLSARSNFSQLLHSLEKLDQARTAVGRIFHANRAQKDLVDLISHMGIALHSVSTPYEEPGLPWPDLALGSHFEEMLKAFKAAQFEQINSSTYWEHVDKALAHYDDLILAIQGRVVGKTARWERRIAGRFNSVQTFAPPVDLKRPIRAR
jgi:hypothetical protein